MSTSRRQRGKWAGAEEWEKGARAELTEEDRELLMEWARTMESRLRAMDGVGDLPD